MYTKKQKKSILLSDVYPPSINSNIYVIILHIAEFDFIYTVGGVGGVEYCTIGDGDDAACKRICGGGGDDNAHWICGGGGDDINEYFLVTAIGAKIPASVSGSMVPKAQYIGGCTFCNWFSSAKMSSTFITEYSKVGELE